MNLSLFGGAPSFAKAFGFPTEWMGRIGPGKRVQMTSNFTNRSKTDRFSYGFHSPVRWFCHVGFKS